MIRGRIRQPEAPKAPPIIWSVTRLHIRELLVDTFTKDKRPLLLVDRLVVGEKSQLTSESWRKVIVLGGRRVGLRRWILSTTKGYDGVR